MTDQRALSALRVPPAAGTTCTCDPNLAHLEVHHIACPEHGLAAFMQSLRKIEATA